MSYPYHNRIVTVKQAKPNLIQKSGFVFFLPLVVWQCIDKEF